MLTVESTVTDFSRIMESYHWLKKFLDMLFSVMKNVEARRAFTLFLQTGFN